jgi:hypothetical protein
LSADPVLKAMPTCEEEAQAEYNKGDLEPMRKDLLR